MACFPELERFLQTQTFQDNVYAELMHRNLISDGYQWKMFCKPNYERNAMVISIYIAKQTKIEVYLDFYALEKLSDFPELLKKHVYEQIIFILENIQILKKLDSDQTMEALKKYNNNIEEETTMAKTQNEIEFENFAKERQAQAEASLQAYKTKVENEIEAKRLECLEADKKERAYQAAAQYRYFFDGLLITGFDENQAMAILLEKCEVTRFDMKG